MSQKEPLKKFGSIKMEPLEGQFFDMKPAKKGAKPPLPGRGEYARFALIAFLAFVGLSVGSAVVNGRDIIHESEQLAIAGYEEIKTGVDRLLEQDDLSASVAFSNAEGSFESLRQSASFLNTKADALMGDGLYLSAANTLLESALAVSEIGQKLAELLGSLRTMPQRFISGDENLMEVVYEKEAALQDIKLSAIEIQNKLARIKLGVLPDSLQVKIREVQAQVGDFLATLLELDHYFDQLYTLLGDDIMHRYLVLFQNNHEIRATGGFIGSYMIVEVNDGRIIKMEAKDVYESDGQLNTFVEAPAGIDQVASQLFMRDANYNPDFPAAAQEIMWFLEESRGPSVDTVIAIDQTLVEGLLEFTGTLRLPSVPFQIRADNFNDLISFHTEAKLSEGATPKQLLFDLIPAFKSKLSALKDISALRDIAERMIAEGHVQAYSAHDDIQELFHEWGISGEMIGVDEKTDYLSVVRTSIGGNKSDGFVDMKLGHDTYLDARGELSNVLTIYKTHTWSHQDETKLENLIASYGTGKLTKEDLYFILGRGPNVDYTRVYVSLGSQLQSAEGVDISDVRITEENGYTVFGFDSDPLYPGKASQVKLAYKLPYMLSMTPSDNYKLVAQRQAGSENVSLRKSLSTNEIWKIEKTFPASDAFSLEPSLETSFDDTVIFMSAVSRN